MISKKGLCISTITLLILALIAAIFRLSQIEQNSKQKHKQFVSEIRTEQAENEEIAKPLVLEMLANVLLVRNIYDKNNQPLEVVRRGKRGDGGYVVPEIALQKADVLLGYGIDQDISFEESFSDTYNKPSYGFDCGPENVEIKNPLCKFVRECIYSDKSLYYFQKSSGSFSSFTEQLNKLNLKDKKVFIKMDIEGSEFDAFKDIYQYASNITGIAVEIHEVGGLKNATKALTLLKRLSNDFYVVHVHGANCCDTVPVENVIGGLPKVLEVTLINKSLVDHATISENQSHPGPLDEPTDPRKPDLKFEILKAVNQ